MSAQPFLFHFAQVHADFRHAELHSVAALHGFALDLSAHDASRPFAVLSLPEAHARALAARCVLVKAVYEFYGRGTSYAAVHEYNRVHSAPRWEKYVEDTSFRFVVDAYNHRIPQARQRAVVESFAYMAFRGKIDMTSPEIVLAVLEEYPDRRGRGRDVHDGDGDFVEVFFGRLIAEGAARPLIHTFDVKKRAYFGNTSMEAEISLLMANQTLSAPGKLIYDPFAGTGSMLYTVAHFGASVFGSDIDGRQMRGKQDVPGIMRAAEQYGVAPRVLGLATFDVTQNPWRRGELFDAIVTDPPYGVRAGAKRIGRKKERATPVIPRPDLAYVPPTKPYELAELAADLVLLARYLLVPGGRLVFFLPTVTDEYADVDVDGLVCDGIQLVANSLQDFGSWGRRLITMRKATSERFPRPTFAPPQAPDDGRAHVPAHTDFRGKYFSGFGKAADTGTPVADVPEHLEEVVSPQ